MKKTFGILFSLIVVSLTLSPPTYAKMTAEQLQQKLINRLDSSDENTSVVSSNEQGEKKEQTSPHTSQSLSHFEQQIFSDANRFHPSAELTTLTSMQKLGNSSAPQLPDFTKRGTLSAGNNLEPQTEIPIRSWN